MRQKQVAQNTQAMADSQGQARSLTAKARTEAEQLLSEAKQQAAALRETRRVEGATEIEHQRETLKRTAEQLESWEVTLKRTEAQIQTRSEVLTAREAALASYGDRQKAAFAAQKQAEIAARQRLQDIAGESFRDARQRLVTEWTEQVRQACAKLKVYALQPDLDARGLTAKRIDGVSLVDYGGFVDLIVQHPTSHAWL